MLAYQDQTVREGRLRFGVPGGRLDGHLAVRLQPLREQSDQRKQPQQAGRRTRYRQVAPLALRFYAQVRAGFFKGDFDRPAHYHPLDDLRRRRVQLGASEDFVAALACAGSRAIT